MPLMDWFGGIWKSFVEAFRRFFRPPIPALPFVNRIYGHIIYRPIERATWDIPKGMTTLKEFLDFCREKGVEQKRNEHPIALEIYCIITTREPLTHLQFLHIVKLLRNELLSEFFSPDIPDNFMEWGYDYEQKTAEPLKAVKRWSRDGMHFEVEKDITEEIRRGLEIEYL